MTDEPEKPKSFRDPVEPETRAERLLADCVLRGVTADVSGFEDEAEKEVRSAFLRGLCLNAENLNIAPRGLWLKGAKVLGTLDLDGVTLDRTLWFSNCIFTDRPILRDARGKTLGFIDCILPGIAADRLFLTGSLSLRGTMVIGEARFPGAKITVQVDCTEASFTNIGGKAFFADGLEVVDGLIFRGVTVAGETRLLGAKVGGQLICVEATFSNEGEAAFIADHLEVGRSLSFWRTTVTGETRLLSAKVGGQVDCTGASFVNEGGVAFDANRLEIEEALFFRELKAPIIGGMSLNHASVGSLVADGSGWPKPGNLDLDGFYYRTLGAYHPWPTLLGWIERQHSMQFTPQPYDHAIKVYRDAGHFADAREMGIAKEDAYRKHGGLDWWHQGLLSISKWTLAYGYKRWRALAWMFYAVIFAWMMFNSAYQQGYMRPSKERVFLHDCFTGVAVPSACAGWAERPLKWQKAPFYLPKDYPSFNALMYTLDTFFPFVDLHQEAYWLPWAGGQYGWVFWVWLWIHIITGWVLSTMAVSGLTGLIHKD